MMKTMMIAAALVCCLAAWARNDWYSPPREIQPGVEIIDTLPPHASSADVHVRLQRTTKGADSWILIWNYLDDDNYVKAVANLPDQRIYDDVYVPEATIDVVEVRNGVETPVVSSNISVPEATLSLKLAYDGYSARLYAGCKDKMLVGRVPYNANAGGEVRVITSERTLAHRLTADSYSNPAPAYATDQAPAEGSLDPVAGHWEYLDRDINRDLASIGGKYRLEIVARLDGDYEIVYQDGATVNADDWQPPRLKGWLHPSGFKGNFDLIWYDAQGRLLDDDNEAQLSDDGMVLTLRFPVYKSQIRFKRSQGANSP